MKVLKHGVRLVVLLAVCALIVACPEPSGNLGDAENEFEVSLGYQQDTGASRSINDDGAVVKVYAKVFNSAREHLPAIDAASDISGVTKLTKNGGKWSATVKLESPVNGTITFFVWAENTTGQHLYSGDGSINVPGTSSITVVTEAGYSMGDMGPAGGYIFYDDSLGYDGDFDGTIEEGEKDVLDGTHDGTLTGAQYLEAAPYGWYNGATDSNGIYIGNADPSFQWGAFGYAVNPSATAIAVASGQTNTANIVNYHDSLATLYPSKGNYYLNPTGYYIGNDGTVAAKICADYTGGGYEDWFLPSLNEMGMIVDNLQTLDPPSGGLSESEYWTSSESDNNSSWCQAFDGRGEVDRTSKFKVRPVRAF